MILDEKTAGNRRLLAQTAAWYFERLIADPAMEVVVVPGPGLFV